MERDQVVANFGTACTALHTLLHKSVALTTLQIQFITTELYTLEVALKSYNSKNPDRDTFTTPPA
jgi:chemotaxis protein CheY-P-specific phosphatase CheC